MLFYYSKQGPTWNGVWTSWFWELVPILNLKMMYHMLRKFPFLFASLKLILRHAMELHKHYHLFHSKKLVYDMLHGGKCILFSILLQSRRNFWCQVCEPMSIKLLIKLIFDLLLYCFMFQTFPCSGSGSTSKLKQLGMEFTVWVFKHVSNCQLKISASISIFLHFVK